MKKQLCLLLAFMSGTSLSYGQWPGQKGPIKVAIFLYNGVELLDFAGPSEVFAASGFNVFCVTADGLPITCNRTGSFLNKLTPDYGVKNAPEADIIVLPGGASRVSSEDGRVIHWLQEQLSKGRMVLSVCTGAQILAKTGLIDSLTVTTWYGFIPALQKMLPNSKVVEHTRFVDNGNIITTAGVSAGIDGALHLVDRLQGHEAALSTAKYMEYDKWVPEMGLVIEHNVTKMLRSGKIDEAVRWVRQNPDHPVLYFGDIVNHAKRLSDAGKWTDAKMLAELAVAEYPNLIEGWRVLGDTYRGLKRDCPVSEQDFLSMIRKDGASSVRKKFDSDRSKFPNWLIFSENAIITLGYELMDNKSDEAVEVLKMCTEMYPKSWNSFDSLAEAYWKSGNKQLAARSYKKSLELNPDNKNAVAMLEKIQAAQ